MSIRSTIDRCPESERYTSRSTTVESPSTSTAGLSTAALSTSTKNGDHFLSLQAPTTVANQASSSCHPSGSHPCRPRGDGRRKPANLQQCSNTDSRPPDFIAPDSRKGPQLQDHKSLVAELPRSSACPHPTCSYSGRSRYSNSYSYPNIHSQCFQ